MDQVGIFSIFFDWIRISHATPWLVPINVVVSGRCWVCAMWCWSVVVVGAGGGVGGGGGVGDPADGRFQLLWLGLKRQDG